MFEVLKDAHIRVDKSGVAWIDDTNVKVIEVILDHQVYGHSAEEVHLQYPHLSLAQIHSAFAYYYDHKKEMEFEIERRYRATEALRAKSSHQPSRKKLAAKVAKR